MRLAKFTAAGGYLVYRWYHDEVSRLTDERTD
jgi:hypothetical protein